MRFLCDKVELLGTKTRISYEALGCQDATAVARAQDLDLAGVNDSTGMISPLQR